MKFLKRLFSGPPNARKAQFDGLLYPGDPDSLRESVEELLAAAAPCEETPKALIVPHSELKFSGPVAASAYRCLEGAAEQIKRVVLVGPSQRVPFRGIGATTVEAFGTPLGFVRLTPDAYDPLTGSAEVRAINSAHEPEPSLELQLPFLQTVLEEFTIVPLLVGDAEPGDVAGVLARLWGEEETLIVVASELSRGLNQEEAEARDAGTVEAIESCQTSRLHAGDLSARIIVQGLMMVAEQKNLHARALDRRTSADTAGETEEHVVGYAAVSFF